MANRLRKVQSDEVSLVPRPANQFSDVLLHKNDPTPSDVHVPVPLGDGRKKKRRDAGAKGDIDMPQIDKSALDPEVAEYVTKLEDTVIDLQDRVEKGDTEDSGDPVESLLKSADPALVEYVQGIQKKAEDAEALAKAEQEQRIDREFLAKAATLDHLGEAREVADLLKSASAHLPEADFQALESLLTRANGRVESGELFAEIGKSGGGALGGSDRIEKAAEALMEADATLTKEQAVDAALAKDPALYREYLAEGGH